MARFYIRSIIKVGGSICVALPKKFVERMYLKSDRKIIMSDEVERLEIYKMTTENLKKIKTGG